MEQFTDVLIVPYCYCYHKLLIFLWFFPLRNFRRPMFDKSERIERTTQRPVGLNPLSSSFTDTHTQSKRGSPGLSSSVGQPVPIVIVVNSHRPTISVHYYRRRHYRRRRVCRSPSSSLRCCTRARLPSPSTKLIIITNDPFTVIRPPSAYAVDGIHMHIRYTIYIYTQYSHRCRQRRRCRRR